MERFFASYRGGNIQLSPDDEHHLLKVLRAKKSQEIELVIEGRLMVGEIVSLSPLVISKKEEKTKDSELRSKLILAFSLLKGGHDEWVLMKGTELGASRFIPFLSQRSVVRLDAEEKKKRAARFRKIVLGASSQSKRMTVPEVSDILAFEDLLSLEATYKWMAYEEMSDGSFSLPHKMKEVQEGETCLCLVGPEGGFSKEEAEMAKQAGFSHVSLGKRILRAETASIYLASVFSYSEEG